MENYREKFGDYCFTRMQEYKDYGVAASTVTPEKHNAYCYLRSVLALRFYPEKIFGNGGNSAMDEEAYRRLVIAVDEILPAKRQANRIKRYHLCHYDDGRSDFWKVRDVESEYVGCYHAGKISQTFTTDVLQADTIKELLALCAESDLSFYAVTKRAGQALIPMKKEQIVLFQSDYELGELLELWIRKDGEMCRVTGFPQSQKKEENHGR